jgi:hypothetical protein
MSKRDTYKINIFGSWHKLPKDIFDQKEYPVCSECGRRYVPLKEAAKACISCSGQRSRAADRTLVESMMTPIARHKKIMSGDFVIGAMPMYRAIDTYELHH